MYSIKGRNYVPNANSQKHENLFIQSSLRIVIVISQLNTRHDLSNPKHHIMNTKNVFSMHIYDSVCSCLYRCNGKHFQTELILSRQHPALAPPGEGELEAEGTLALHIL